MERRKAKRIGTKNQKMREREGLSRNAASLEKSIRRSIYCTRSRSRPTRKKRNKKQKDARTFPRFSERRLGVRVCSETKQRDDVEGCKPIKQKKRHQACAVSRPMFLYPKRSFSFFCVLQRNLQGDARVLVRTETLGIGTSERCARAALAK